MQEVHSKLFSFLVKVIFTNFVSSIVSMHSSINSLVNFFLHLQSNNLNIHQYYKIYVTHIYNYLDSKHILYCRQLYQLIFYNHIYIYLYSIFVYYYKYFCLIYICTYIFMPFYFSCFISS